MRAPRHLPVLLPQVLAALTPDKGETFIDGTFGAGGYTRALLDSADDVRVLAIDRDPTAIAAGQDLAAAYGPRLKLVHARFGGLDRLAEAAGWAPVAGGVLDVGVSSMQLDEAARGFSFQADGPLDMRMGAEGPTAADVLNTADEGLIADILYHLGEERSSRAIARRILAQRAQQPLTRTSELADLVARVLGREKIAGKHAATRTFQALRIYVNDELGELADALSAAERVLKPGGRLAVVSFHSLEDGLVKRFLRDRSSLPQQGSRHLPPSSATGPRPTFSLTESRPLSATDAETAANPRARSARLRWAVRSQAPAWAVEAAEQLSVPRL
ncbi:MAG: 16S rRNA (cytosine(1402)-N(4))-methyltransferase RsmH [Hyphomicrobiaceae bacterium]|nr:16S rRNA (cytosine(1402)-N(4))-methyltransferase RsmH [Hyphomicrobiaceae bacterium]